METIYHVVIIIFIFCFQILLCAECIILFLFQTQIIYFKLWKSILIFTAFSKPL